MSTSLAPLIRVLRQHRAASIGAFSTSIGVTVVEVLLPLLTRDAVDVATGQAGAGESSTATTLFPEPFPAMGHCGVSGHCDGRAICPAIFQAFQRRYFVH